MYNNLTACTVTSLCVPFAAQYRVVLVTRCVHTVMLYVILILRTRTNWRQGRLTLLAKTQHLVIY